MRPNATKPSLDTLVPANPNKPYDMQELIPKVVDEGDFFEIGKPTSPRTSSPASAAWTATTVGVVANQPQVLAGVLDIDSHAKPPASCASATLQHPACDLRRRAGLHAGHQAGVWRPDQARAKLLFAYAEATVPKVTVITRKAYGGAYDVMSSKHLRGDVNYAWPTAEIAVMGAKGAVEIIFRAEHRRRADRLARQAEYEARFANPFVAASPRLHRRRASCRVRRDAGSSGR